MKMLHLSKRQRSQRSEKQLARELGGRVQPASGAIPAAPLKGDVVAGGYVFDDKTTQAASFGVKLDVFMKLRMDAFRQGKKPAMRIHFERYNRSLFVVSEEDFKRNFTSKEP